MTTTEIFSEFIDNLAIDNKEQISLRYVEITCCLNKNFRETDSKTANSLQVGSYGRCTGIKGISDLDMLYIMPVGKWDDYKNDQSKLLTDVKNTIQDRYPTTDIRVDRLVVQVIYNDFKIEVQPVFEEDDGSFKYPDSYDGGSWKITKPRDEIQAMQEFTEEKNNNLRNLCKMVRAWKNEVGLAIGGLLIDTLVYNFLSINHEYDNKSFGSYDLLCRDFFQYLASEPDKEYYLALGSNQQVKVKEKFQKQAQEAYKIVLDSIDAVEKDNNKTANKKWRSVFGNNFPKYDTTEDDRSIYNFNNTEEFIEDKHPVDIKYSIKIKCTVSQKGYRDHDLYEMQSKNMPLHPNKKLYFYISKHDLPEGHNITWKVLNRGTEAERRNCIRGQLIADKGFKNINETTDFQGNHMVECYAIKNNIVIAKTKIDVPIK
jgi:hypothetical protein